MIVEIPLAELRVGDQVLSFLDPRNVASCNGSAAPDGFVPMFRPSRVSAIHARGATLEVLNTDGGSWEQAWHAWPYSDDRARDWTIRVDWLVYANPESAARLREYLEALL